MVEVKNRMYRVTIYGLKKIKNLKKTLIQPKIGNLIHVLSTYSSINP